jgi:1-deoxy-D-xylulose-5-phosphate synthase
MRAIPNVVIMAPANEDECYQMLETGYQYKGPAAVRYPRGGGIGEYTLKEKVEKLKIGRAKIIEEGEGVAILSFGAMLENSKKAAKELGATLVNMRFVKPLDEELLKKLSQSHDYFITIEDNSIKGGAGSAVNEFVLNNKLDVKVKNLGLPDEFLPHGGRDEILEEAGLGEDGILESIRDFIS